MVAKAIFSIVLVLASSSVGPVGTFTDVDGGALVFPANKQFGYAAAPGDTVRANDHILGTKRDGRVEILLGNESTIILEGCAYLRIIEAGRGRVVIEVLKGRIRGLCTDFGLIIRTPEGVTRVDQGSSFNINVQ